MTGQNLLDMMELVNQELQLQSGEADVVRGLIALNVAQDYFESIAATRPGFKGDTAGAVTASAAIETTAFPTSVLRIDKLQMQDDSGAIMYDLDEIPDNYTGGHRASRSWPYHLFASTLTGRPIAYWTQGTNIYWDPLPDATYTVRWYGFQTASNITAGGTFAYPDVVAFPIASFATQLMNIGVGDDPGAHQALAMQTFAPVIQTLSNPTRQSPPAYYYHYRYNT